jgi:hypothetical protein
VDIEVTPSTEKSYLKGTLKPASSVNKLIYPPRQLSEWQPIPLDLAIAAN